MSSSSEHEEDDIEMGSDEDEEEVQSGAEDDDDDNDEEEVKSEDEDDEEEEEKALDASDTESDDDEVNSDEVGDDEDVPADSKKIKLSKGIVKKVTASVMSKNEKRQGKQLYLRFPSRLPTEVPECEALVKKLSKLITHVHRPRQPAARFCLVDFDTSENRDKAFAEISKNGENIVVAMPKVDDEDFVKTLINKKLKAYEKKISKALLKKESKKNAAKEHFTSSIVILNAPKNTSTAQLKELFPDAVDIQTKPAVNKFDGKMFVSITFPTTFDAKKNCKRKLKLENTPLKIRFSKADKPKKEQMPPKNKKKVAKPAEATTESENGKTETPAPKKAGKKKNNKNAKKGKAPKVAENGNTEEPPVKKVKNVPSAIAPKNPKQAKKAHPPINKKNSPIKKNKPAGKPKFNKQKNQPQKKGKGKGPVASK